MRGGGCLRWKASGCSSRRTPDVLKQPVATRPKSFRSSARQWPYVERAKKAYLQAAAAAFPEFDNPGVGSVVAALQKRMAGEVDKLA